MSIKPLTAIPLTDTSATDTFKSTADTVLTDDAANSALVFGITGATKAANTINSISYDYLLTKTYGKLYINSSTGQYLLEPIAANVNAAKETVSETYPITVDNSGTISTADLTVTVKGVDDKPAVTDQNSYNVFFKISVDNNVLTADMTSKFNGWVALGFSADPLMPATDTYIAGYDPTTKKSYGFDGLVASNKVQPPIDATQNWTLLSASESIVGTSVVASRSLNTGDTVGDYDLSAAPYYLMWSYQISDDTGTKGHTGRGASSTPISLKNGDDYILIGDQFTISDADKDAFSNTVKTQGKYGVASVDNSKGAWSYLLDEHQLSTTQLQSLAANEVLSDSVTFSFSAGGSAPQDRLVSFPIAYGSNDAPAGAMTLSASPSVGGAISATNTITDADASADELAATRYQWQMSPDGQQWLNIDGANTLKINQLDDYLQGQKLRIVASYFDGGTHESVASSASSKVTTSKASSLITSPQPEFALADDSASVQYTGDKNAKLTGNGLQNKLTSGSSNDVLNGGSGADLMSGGAGNDTYKVDNLKDKITENTDSGIDSVESTIDWILGNNLENLTLLGSAKKATGNTLSNTLTGNASDNIFNGKGGHDVFTGGAGKDQFLFDQKPIDSNSSVITDFTPGQDQLLLSKKIFTYTDASHLSYNDTTGVLSYDADASGSKYSPVVIVTLTGAPHITSVDYQLF